MSTEVRVLYFSLNPEAVNAFHDYVEKNHFDKMCSFCLYDKDTVSNFKHASDLPSFLEQHNDHGRLFVIIDYPSFYESYCVYNPILVKDTFSYKSAADIIRRTILQFPEDMFLFDESWKSINGGKDDDDRVDFTSFLFGKQNKEIIKEYHQYSVFKHGRRETHPFTAIVRDRTNLFDGSNLRYEIIRFLYNRLHVEKYNFSLSQDSRKDNLAICVEEEHSQNRFNSYALYANGYRVIPVCTSEGLWEINNSYSKWEPKLIVRDYDLQFADTPDDKIFIKIKDEGDSSEYQVNVIDCIRGLKFWDANAPQNDSYKIPSNYKNRIHSLYKDTKQFKPDYLYWSNLQDAPKIETFFVTKGAGHLRIRPHGRDKGFIPFDKKRRAKIAGITKPVSGIYKPFQSNRAIKKRYASFKLDGWIHFKIREFNKDIHRFLLRTETDKKLKTQEWSIVTSREGHDHGVPLDIYNLAKNMIERSETYYNNGKFIRAAILSSEAIEVLNGFHEALLLRAYHILSISENAVAMNTIGSNEDALVADANFRIAKIEHEVSRMIHRKNKVVDIERRYLTYNILNQIYSDCRTFCRKKEHFDAENCFISAMGYVADGYSLIDIVLGSLARFRKFRERIRSLIPF